MKFYNIKACHHNYNDTGTLENNDTDKYVEPTRFLYSTDANYSAKNTNQQKYILCSTKEFANDFID